MSRFFKKESIGFWDLGVLVLISFTLYFMVRYVPFGVDIKVHNFFLIEYLEKGHFPIPPGYYFLIYLLDFLISWKYPFLLSSFLVLTCFIWWKFRLLRAFLLGSNSFSNQAASIWAITFLFIGPLILSGEPFGFWYFGKFTSSIWHNSTLIASLPFALLLFWKTLEWWEEDQPKMPWNLSVLGLVILLIKPSFLFCYLPVFPIFTWFRERKFTPKVFQAAGLSILLLGLLYLEKHLIYVWDPMIVQEYPQEQQPQILLKPFHVWKHYSAHPILDFLSSFALSLVFLAFWGKSAFRSHTFRFSFALLVLALLIFFLLAESGFREWHGNFYWQIPITLLIHQVWMLILVQQDFEGAEHKIQARFLVFYLVFGLHLVFGLAYWGRIFLEKTIS